MRDKEEYDRRRFGMKVQVDLETGCHEWVGTKTTGGYGLFSLDKKRQLAHRVAWTWAWGEIPKGQLVRHRCDNRCCVNAMHLFLGTHQAPCLDPDGAGRGTEEPGAGAHSTDQTVVRGVVQVTRKQCYQAAHEFLSSDPEVTGLGEFLFQFEKRVLEQLAEPDPETWALFEEIVGDETSPST